MTLEAVVNIASEFYRRSDVSIAQLVIDSGYGSNPSIICLESVERVLSDAPDLVDAWLRLSADKRTSSGWYVKSDADGRFVVGSLIGGDEMIYQSAVSAVASFIVHEVKDVAGRLRPAG